MFPVLVPNVSSGSSAVGGIRTVIRLLSVLILSGFWAAPIQAESPPRHSEAVPVFECGFERSDDLNFDRWPDGWRRARGPRFPHYLSINMADTAPHQGEGCLQVRLDGGSAAVFAPAVPVSSLFSYVLEAHLRTEGLEHSRAFLRVQLFDADDRLLETHESARYQNLKDWTLVRVGPISPKTSLVGDARIGASDESGAPHHAVVSVHLESGLREDLSGTAWFDDLWFAQLPRMVLRSDVSHNVFQRFEDVALTCEVSGVSAPRPRMQFQLLDVHGKVLREEELIIEGAAIERYEELQRTRRTEDGNEVRKAYAGSVTWKPFSDAAEPLSWKLPARKFGFYKVRVAVEGDTGAMLIRTAPLAVVAPISTGSRGEFGWSLPRGEDPLPLKALVDLLSHSAINWVKFPIWFDEDDHRQADDLGWFAERLTARGIQLVGVLDRPPPAQRELFGDHEQLPVALVFVERELWGQLLNPILTRLSLKVAWWQLGADDDVSFVGATNLDAKVAEIKTHLERFGQTAQIGFNWRWLYEPPSAEGAPWAFLCQTVDPAFTADELERYLAAETKVQGRQWVMLQPLPRDDYALETRVKDLVARMLAAKKHDVRGIFLTDPFDPQTGVMSRDGTPAELFVPWRTTASVVNGAEFLGVLELPGKSRNMVFRKGDDAVMAVWNDVPCEEVLYLGEDVKQVDLWGMTHDVENSTEGQRTRQVIPVGRLPTFITGLNLPVAKWRLGCQFDKNQLSSTFGREQAATVRFHNEFDEGISGEMVLRTPQDWSVSPFVTPFRLGSGDTKTQPLRVLLRVDASSGSQPVQIDFTLQGARNYTFSVFRTIQVGRGDVEVELFTRIDDDGNLIVEQQLTNKSDETVSFNCLLFSSVRRRERKQVLNVGRGQVADTYLFPDGRELVGQTLWLRAEELGGRGRILNYHVTVQP